MMAYPNAVVNVDMPKPVSLKALMMKTLVQISEEGPGTFQEEN